MKKRDIPKEILERAESELLADEHLLWVGLPGGKSSNVTSFLVPIIFGLASFLVLAAFTFVLIARNSGSAGNIMAIIPAILMATLFSIVAAIAQKTQQRANLYLVTNRRAMILRRNSVQSFGPEDLQFIERKMHRNGRGDIIFKHDFYETQALGFWDVENPLEVEALMLETFRSKEPQKHRLLDEQSDSYYDDYQDDIQQAKQS